MPKTRNSRLMWCGVFVLSFTSSLGASVFGACPCEGGHNAPPCAGNGSHYFQAFIDDSCCFPPNLLKVEWNGIFGVQSALVPSVSQGRWRTNTLGVTWQVQRQSDGTNSGHWTVSWVTGTSVFGSDSPVSSSNCQESVSWGDQHGNWSVTPCEWMKPNCQLLAATNYIKTIEFVGIKGERGPYVLSHARSQEWEFDSDGPTSMSNLVITTSSSRSAANVRMSFQVRCVDPSSGRLQILLIGEPLHSTSSNLKEDSALLASYSSPPIYTNAGGGIAGMVISNDSCGEFGSGWDSMDQGGYAVIRISKKPF